ncbi:MAG: hypothetical protein QM831_00140 [Kofleriaceae bacterium]
MIVLPLHGTNRVLVCDGNACHERGIAAGTARAFGQLAEPVVGGGGWADFAIVFDSKGNSLVRVGDVVSPGPTIECFGIRDVAFASDARRFAVAFDTDSWYSNGQIALFDVQPDGRLDRRSFTFDSRDCFLIDAAALSPDGTHLAAAGLDITFSSVGDWNYGQIEKVFVVDIARSMTVLDLVVGETDTPSQHRRTPVALGRHVWFCDNVPLVPDANRDEALECLAIAVADDGALIALTTDRLYIYLDEQRVAEHVVNATSFAIVGERIVVAGDQLNLIAR